MKTFFGLVFGISGAILTLWGGYYCLTGGTKTMLDPLPVNAMAGGLTGLALLVVGFIWSRD